MDMIDVDFRYAMREEYQVTRAAIEVDRTEPMTGTVEIDETRYYS